MNTSPKLVRVLAACALASSIAACTVAQGRQDVAAYVDDSVITNTIRARYVEDPVVSFGDIKVTTMQGNVRLTGRVDSATERSRATQIAQAVPGVRSVDNDVAVRRR